MKLKYYMRGLAVGIIFSVFIFTLTGASEKKIMTNAEIKKAAAALGMVDDNNLSVLKPTETPMPTISIIPEATATPSPVPTPEATPIPAPTATPIPTPTVAPTLTPVPTGQSASKETITLEIVKGMYSYAVAQKAYEIGLVDNAEEFDDYLKDNGYASIIRINTYVFEKGATYQQIAEAITKKPE